MNNTEKKQKEKISTPMKEKPKEKMYSQHRCVDAIACEYADYCHNGNDCGYYASDR